MSMDKFEKTAFRIWRGIAAVGAVILFLDMCFVILNIILRRFFNSPVIGSTEIVRYTSLVAASLALAYNQYCDGNIRVTLVMDMTSPKVRDIISFVADALVTCGFAFVTYYLIQYTINLYSKGDTTMELSMSSWLFSAVLCGGFALMLLSSIVKVAVRGHCLFGKKDYENHKEEINRSLEA